MVRGDAVVGIADRDEIGPTRGAERVGRRLGPAARAGREQGQRHVAVVEQHLPCRHVDGLLPGRCLGGDAEIGLAASVPVDVERGAGPPAREGVGARGDGLRLERRRKPGRGHLRRHDAVEVLLERQHVDRAELLARHVDEDPAPVAVAERERRPGRRRKRERRIESLLRPAVDRELELRSECRRAGGERVVDAVAVLDGDRLLRRDGQRLLPAREQDPDRCCGRLGERRARVVGREDLVVRVALLRVALGSPLTHPHAVPVAVTADEEEGSGLRRGDIVRTGRGRRVRRRREQNRGDTGGEGGERADQQALRVASRPSG